MFRRLNELGSSDSSDIFYSRILPGRIANIEELQFRLRRYLQRHLEEREDEQIKEDNSNPNFMQEKDMNFRLYPFYINWKKIEANKSEYYRIFLHFGYFGASIFSSFEEKYPSLNVNNMVILVFLFFVYAFDFHAITPCCSVYQSPAVSPSAAVRPSDPRSR